MNKKGVSLISLSITIIVIVILAAITMNASSNSIDEAHKVKFQNDLKNAVNDLDAYNQRALIRSTIPYDSDDLYWDGESERTVNSARIEDPTQEDRIYYILEGDVPETLDNKITIENGRIKIDKSYKTEYEWATEMYTYMEY